MGLEIIGVGFGRAETLCLKLASERLGLGWCCHRTEIFRTRERVLVYRAGQTRGATFGQFDLKRENG